MAKCLAATAGSPQTFAICLRCPAAMQHSLVAGLQLTGKVLIVQQGHSNVAIKQVDEHVYFIATEAHQRRADNAQRHWTTVMQKVTCSDMLKLPEVATIEWVRPFNRHLQRLLGLGDAHATKADVVNAMRQEDEHELLAMMPEAAALIEEGQLHVLPALHDALNASAPPALADCEHVFGTENLLSLAVPGPCTACCMTAERQRDEGKIKGFTKCTLCSTVRCKSCMSESDELQRERRELLRAYHEATRTHVWDATGESCDSCGAEAAKACACGEERCNQCAHTHSWMPTADDDDAACIFCGDDAGSKCKCSCGAVRCESCAEIQDKSACPSAGLWWKQHPAQPGPLYVVDLPRMKRAEKLEWLAVELGEEEASLQAFAEMFLQKFADKICQDKQKAECLKLYREYAKIAQKTSLSEEQRQKLYSTTCMIPPDELTNFERVWDPKAPPRCWECSKEVRCTSAGRVFCSDACRDAGQTWTCGECGSRVVIQSGVRVCTSGEGCWVAKDTRGCAERKRRGEEEGGVPSTLHIAGQMWMWPLKREVDPNHVPAWTKRQRL